MSMAQGRSRDRAREAGHAAQAQVASATTDPGQASEPRPGKAPPQRQADDFVSQETRLLVASAIRAVDTCLSNLPTVADAATKLRLMQRARGKVVAGLDALLEEPFLWETSGSFGEWGAADSGALEALFTDAVYELLEEGGHKPPPSASDLVLAVRDSIAALTASHDTMDRPRLASATRISLTRLRSALDGLEAIPVTWRPRLLLRAKRVLNVIQVGLLALPLAIGSGVAVDMGKDVIRYGTLTAAIQNQEEDEDPSRHDPQNKAIEDAIAQAQLRKAEAEAALAELALAQAKVRHNTSE